MAQIQIVKDKRTGTANLATPPGNQSRNGFLHNCYNTALGRFFQETVKVWLEKGIARIHDKEIPRYDKQAYIFDDPRLKLLHEELIRLTHKYCQDNDKTRKRELVNNVQEIWLFMMKEDIYWRRVGLPYLVEFGEFIVKNKEVLSQLTEEEEKNRQKWG